jgi:hypothetical protein
MVISGVVLSQIKRRGLKSVPQTKQGSAFDEANKTAHKPL